MTFAQAKTNFSTYGASVGDQINFVLGVAFQSGKWKGTVAYAQFPIYDAEENGEAYRQLTLGRRFETALGVKFERDTGFGGSRPIHNQWWQWRQGHSSWFSDGCGNPNSGLQDVGEVVIFRDLPSAGTIKIYNSTTESAGSVNVRGFASGAKVFTGTGASRIEGENIAMPTTPGTSTTSATTFDAGLSLYAIVKPSTNGTLSIYHVNGATETLLGIYEPGETTPAWRRYRIASWHDEDSALVMAKLRHVTLVADNDLVVPDNEQALYYGLRGKNYDDRHDDDKANLYWSKFYDSLNGQLKESQGNMPLVMNLRIGEGFGTLRQRQ